MNANSNPQQDWSELAVGLYEQLTGRNAEITYEFENMRVQVPDRIGQEARHAPWQVDGTIRVHTRDRAQS